MREKTMATLKPSNVVGSYSNYKRGGRRVHMCLNENHMIYVV